MSNSNNKEMSAIDTHPLVTGEDLETWSWEWAKIENKQETPSQYFVRKVNEKAQAYAKAEVSKFAEKVKAEIVCLQTYEHDMDYGTGYVYDKQAVLRIIDILSEQSGASSQK
jgi:hypothetical protein